MTFHLNNPPVMTIHGIISKKKERKFIPFKSSVVNSDKIFNIF